MIVCFGELMIRLSPAGGLRLGQSIPGLLQTWLAGSEANVAAGLTGLGSPARLLTALPPGPAGDAAVRGLRAAGVEVAKILRRDGRMGLFFYEPGSDPRPAVVTYDREHSAMSLAGEDEYDWTGSMAGATWAHTSGITAAISPQGFAAASRFVREAKVRGIRTSLDVNYRSRLWRWSDESPTALAARCLSELAGSVDLLICSPHDAVNLLGVSDVDPDAASVDPAAACEAAAGLASRFGGLRWVAMSMRAGESAGRTTYAALLWDRDAGTAVWSPRSADGSLQPYVIDSVVDRLGAGDAMAAGLIHALAGGQRPQPAADLAAAAGCLKHSISGDFPVWTLDEVRQVIASGGASGRVVR